ncbi:MAG: RNA polymerase sigma factor [Gemmatimonadota bacterium]
MLRWSHEDRHIHGQPRVAATEAQSSDLELVTAALDGSEGAFTELVRRYQDVLYRHALRMTGRPDDAEDVVQAAFVKAWRNLASCQNPERVGAWLFRIGANGCKDFLKSRHQRNVSLEEVPLLKSDARGPEAAAERRSMGQLIMDALQTLPPDQREAFALKHIEGWSYGEMSEKLEVSVAALKMRVHRARDELQVLLAEYRGG